MGFVVGLRVGLALWMGCSGVVVVEWSLSDGCCRVAGAKLDLLHWADGFLLAVEMTGFGVHGGFNNE
jgi:hypothetical protein